MKLIIIIVVVIMLVAGGGAATYFFVLAEPKKEEKGPQLPPPPVFLKMDTLSVGVIRDGSIKEYVVLDITLEMRDEAAKSLAENKMPKLRDVYIAGLSEYFANLPSLKEGAKVPQIKRRLLSQSEKALGPGAVKDVLVQGIFERDWKPTK